MSGMAQPGSPLSVSSVAQLALSLLAIVALIFALSWVLTRFKLAGPKGRGGIFVLDELAVGPRERILLIGVGESQVLVGIGAAGMVGLTPLAAPIMPTGTPPAASFADRLRELKKGLGSAA